MPKKAAAKKTPKKKVSSDDEFTADIGGLSLNDAQPQKTPPKGTNPVGNDWEAEKVAAINSHDEQVITPALIELRKLLSVADSEIYDKAVNSGILPRLAILLQSSNTTIQFETSWILTNLASGNESQTAAVVASGVFPTFVGLVRNADATLDVREQAVWAIGNIVGGNVQLRDVAISLGAVDAILPLLVEASARVTTLRNSTWTLSNLLRGKPYPVLDAALMKKVFASLAHLIYSQDEEVIVDACWAISYLSDGPSEKIQACIESGVPRRLVELTAHKNASVVTPALRAIANIVTGDDAQTQVMMNCGIVAALTSLLGHAKRTVRKEACWAFSNVLAGNRTQIQAVIDAAAIPKILHHVGSSDVDTRKEAAWAVSNFTAGASIEQLRYLDSQGGLEALCKCLTDVKEVKVLTVVIEAIENFLKDGALNATREFATQIENFGGLGALEALQHNPSEQVYQKVVSILEKYFEVESETMQTMDFSAPAQHQPQSESSFTVPPASVNNERHSLEDTNLGGFALPSQRLPDFIGY